VKTRLEKIKEMVMKVEGELSIVFQNSDFENSKKEEKILQLVKILNDGK
jgi:hypothetical protein